MPLLSRLTTATASHRYSLTPQAVKLVPAGM